jgi:NDP-sugar pyrophosphorylase family protein
LDIAAIPVALLAGGLATRLRPLTCTVPKVMVDVAGRPFIDHQLALLRAHGIRRVVLCLGHLGEMVEGYLGDGSARGMEVRYSYDGDRLLDTGGALRQAAPLLDEVFWVLYGDSYLEVDYHAVLADFVRQDALGLMTVMHNGDRWDRSNAVFREGRVVYHSKRHRTPEMQHIDYGLSLLRREALAYLPPDGSCDLADLFGELIARGRMAGHEVTRRFYEIGSPAGLAETRAYLEGHAA